MFCFLYDDVLTGLGGSSLGVKVPVAATRDDLDFTDDLFDPTSQAFTDMEQRFCEEVRIRYDYSTIIVNLI